MYNGNSVSPSPFQINKFKKNHVLRIQPAYESSEGTTHYGVTVRNSRCWRLQALGIYNS